MLRGCLITLVTVFSLVNCGSFQTVPYSSQGEFSSPGDFSGPDEFMNDPGIKRSEPRIRSEPFRLVSPVKKLKMSRGFQPGGRREHHGIDIVGRRHDPIFASHEGTVIYAGSKFRGYGRMIIVEYNQQWATLYAHLTKISVKTGQEVASGQKIGTMGRTGRASGVHLHFELIENKIPIDPEPWFK